MCQGKRGTRERHLECPLTPPTAIRREAAEAIVNIRWSEWSEQRVTKLREKLKIMWAKVFPRKMHTQLGELEEQLATDS